MTPQPFTNWSRTFSCQPALLRQPRSEEEIVECLQEARKHQLKVRVVGAGHSPSDIACCEGGLMLQLDGYNRILSHTQLSVTCQSGVRLWQLQDYLRQHGLSLKAFGSIAEQSVGGALSTATHSTGVGYGCMSTWVTSMRLVLADGSIQELARRQEQEGMKEEEALTRAEENSPLKQDLMMAALCSFGVLGVISVVTLDVVPSFQLSVQREVLSVQQVLSQWLDLASSADHVRFWWYPYTHKVLVWRANRVPYVVDEKPLLTTRRTTTAALSILTYCCKRPFQILKEWFTERLVHYHLLQALYALSGWWPSLLPWIHQRYAPTPWSPQSSLWSCLSSLWNPTPSAAYGLIDKDPQVADSFQQFTFDCLFAQHVTEWAVDGADGPKAFRDLVEWVEQQPQLPHKHKWVAHSPVEVRFVQGDTIWLSPAYARPHICYIGIIVYRPYGWDLHPRQPYWGVYEQIMQSLHGRPHWAKAHRMTPEELSRVYPRFRDFCRLRQRVDPCGLFLNEYARRHLWVTDEE